MTTLRTLKQQAKKACKAKNITHSKALDEIAIGLGFRNWSLLHRHFLENPQSYFPEVKPAAVGPLTRHPL